jgi:hypothetical protein
MAMAHAPGLSRAQESILPSDGISEAHDQARMPQAGAAETAPGRLRRLRRALQGA